MKFPTIKYQSGLEVSRAAFLLKMTSLDVAYAGTPSSHNQRRSNMNADHFKGKWNQFKGELKKQWGEITDDDLTTVEGNYDKFKGLMQERYADRKDEVSKWADEWYRTAQTNTKESETVARSGRK